MLKLPQTANLVLGPLPLAPIRFSRTAIAAAVAIRIALEKWRNTSYNYAPVPPFRFIGRNKQKLLAVSLRDKIFPWDIELLRQHLGDSLRTAVGQAQIVDHRTHRIGVSLNEKDLARVLAGDVAHDSRHRFQHRRLFGANFPGAELEVDRVEANTAHPLAKVNAGQDFIQRVTPV